MCKHTSTPPQVTCQKLKGFRRLTYILALADVKSFANHRPGLPTDLCPTVYQSLTHRWPNLIGTIFRENGA